jgi:hypothetical protein
MSLVALLASAASADAQVIMSPVWIARAPEAALPTKFSDYRDWVYLSCTIKHGVPTACEALKLTPTDFAEAAIHAAQQARIAPEDQGGKPTENGTIYLQIGFPPIVASPQGENAQAGPLNQPANAIRRLNWMSKPTVEQVAGAYPAAARNYRIRHTVFLNCTVQADGRLTCAEPNMHPEFAALGFAEATRSLIPLFQMATSDDDGVATVGRPVLFTIRFRPPEP